MQMIKDGFLYDTDAPGTQLILKAVNPRFGWFFSPVRSTVLLVYRSRNERWFAVVEEYSRTNFRGKCHRQLVPAKGKAESRRALETLNTPEARKALEKYFDIREA